MVIQRLVRFLFGESTARRSSKSVAEDSGVAEGPHQESAPTVSPPWHKHATDPKPVPTLSDFAEEQAGRLAELINESLDIAQNSSDPETRISRVNFAEQKLQEVLELSAKYPHIKAQNTEGVRTEIERLRSLFTATVSFSSEDVLRTKGALAEVEGQPTYALAHMKGDLDVMQACMQAEIENYWRQPGGHRLTAAPFYFERVAILQRKAKNYEAEIAACEAWIEIVDDYKGQDFVKNGISAKVWMGPQSRKIMDRLPRARGLLEKQKAAL